MKPTRRHFVRHVLSLPLVLPLRASEEAAAALRFGIISDVHQDVMPDGVARLTAFITEMKQEKVDFIIQLGDFCVPHERNRAFLNAWDAFAGPRHHVIGNHDMDGGFSRDQTVAFLGMPARHYTFGAGSLRGIVLDGNDPGGKTRGYKRFVADDQLAWLRDQLATDPRPAFVFIHQPVDADNDGCLENSAAVREILATAQLRRPGSIAAVFSGHRHLDYAREIAGVRYVVINSASYWWLNAAAAARETFPPEVHRRHPSLKSVAAYRDPLWALVTIDPQKKRLTIAGRRTEWIGPDPWSRGETAPWPREELRPAISNHLWQG